MPGASKACQQLLLTPRFVDQYQGEREKVQGRGRNNVSAQMGRYPGNEETNTLLCAHTGASARALFKGPPHHLCGARFIMLDWRLMSTLWRMLTVSATLSSSGKHRACSVAYGERLQCGVWRWQSAYPLRATMSFRRSVGVTTTLANCRAKPLFSADAAMRPMAAAVPDRGYRLLLTQVPR
jgi:hypothetical protein